MTARAFDAAVAEILRWESGYVSDPRDPGGETNCGISKRSYPNLDIKKLTAADAEAIYRRDFWVRYHCDDLPADVAILLFDAAVNQGPRAAVKLLQEAAGVAVDGAIGPRTILAAAKPGVAAELAARRALRYAGTGGVERFGLGWYRRLIAMYHSAIREA